MTLLYERLGGHQAISLVVDKFYEFMLNDNRVAHYFNNTDMDKQRQRQKQFITLVTGGPNQYQGKDMKTAHKGMGIGHMEFDATWQNLLKALTHFNVPKHQINQLKQIFYSVEEEIIQNKNTNYETLNKNALNNEKNNPNLKQQQSLYEKLGGSEAIKLVVNKFYDFMLKDDRVNFYFANTNMDKQRNSQIQFISMVTGGPVVYKGKDMKTAHCPYKITQKEFDATWENLHEALNVYKVPSNLTNQLKEIFYSVESDIVNAKDQTYSKEYSSLQKCPMSQLSINEQNHDQQSLYQRLGGNGALKLVVNRFYDLVLQNPQVNFYFTNTDMTKQRNSQLQFLSMVTGGAVLYKGKDMRSAHCPYKITEREFDITWQSLQTSMRYYKVGDELIRQVKDIFYSVEGEIVREHKIGRRQQKVQVKASEEWQSYNKHKEQVKQQPIIPVTISHTPTNEHNQDLKNIYCPFSQHAKVSQQQKRQLKQQFIEKQHESKQVKKLNNSPYQKTYY